MARSARKSLGAGLLALVVVAAASAVPASAKTQATPSGTITLATVTTYKPGFDILLANFNRIYPDIKVNPTYYVSGGPYTNALATQFTAGSGPDLVWLVGGGAGPTFTWPFARAGYLTPINNRPWVKRMYAPDKYLYSYQNKVYTYDFGLSILATPSYNKDFFAQNGLAVPRTFSQLLNLCRRIAGMGKTPIAWAGGSAAVNANNVVALAASTVMRQDRNWLQKRLRRQTTFVGTPGWRRALQMLVDMKNANCFSQGVEAVQIPQMQQQFAGGNSVMMFTYAGLNAQVAGINPNLKIGLFPPPADVAANTIVTVQPSGGMSLNAKSSNKAAALTFLDFMGREKQQRLFAKINYIVSPFDATKGNLPGIYADLKPWFAAKKVVTNLNGEWPNTSMNTNMGTSIQGLFTGQKSVDDVLRDMDRFFEAA
jgi:raffinose/stachyose/melibiose transport system substrate-binding protein